jgi:hypothetical protein
LVFVALDTPRHIRWLNAVEHERPRSVPPAVEIGLVLEGDGVHDVTRFLVIARSEMTKQSRFLF